MDITLEIRSENGKGIRVAIENAGSFNYDGNSHEIGIRIRKKTRIAEGNDLVAFLNTSKDEDYIYLPKVERIDVVTFEETTYAEPVPNADPLTGQARIPDQKPEDEIKAESFKEPEVNKASDSDIDLVEIPEWCLLGFNSEEAFNKYMDECQRIADDMDRCWSDEVEDMDRIRKKFMLGGRYSKLGTYGTLRMLIEDVVTILNKKSKRKMYWEDAVKVILGEPTWACVCDIVKKDFPSLYLDLTK